MTLGYIYHEVERPLPQLLASMSHRGILLDREYLQALVLQWDDELAALREGPLMGLNPNSNPQIERRLLDGGFHLKKRTKGGTHYSVDEKVLKGLLSQRSDNPFLVALLRHNKLVAWRDTFGVPLLAFSSLDGRVHCRWWQVGTDTGRMSSSEPNLQNIPPIVRPAFMPSPGMTWVKGDYSQIEMRVVAVLAQEEGLLKAYRDNPLTDAHQEVAHLMGLAPSERYKGKTLNFALLYGEGDRALAQQLGVPLREAQRLRALYWERLPHVASWVSATQMAAQAYGYVETLMGRRRAIDIHPGMESWAREARLREAVNMPVQGTAADILKLLMGKYSREEGRFGEGLLLTVHDELDWEVPQDVAMEFVSWARDMAQDVVDLGVPLVFEVNSGERWS